VSQNQSDNSKEKSASVNVAPTSQEIMELLKDSESTTGAFLKESGGVITIITKEPPPPPSKHH
jgi:hypothetical protein